MKTKLLLAVIFSLNFCLLSSQVPQGINYQALAGDASGNPIRNTGLQVKISILSDTTLPATVWEELHPLVRTNAHGIFSLVVGKGTRQPASTVPKFSDISWKTSQLFIRTQVYYQSAWKTMGSAKLWSVPYSLVADNLSGAVGKLSVAGTTSAMDEALFEVKNKNGQTVFAVYNEGVRVYVDDGAKSPKGGFAIGGFDIEKGTPVNYFIISPDSARIYINNASSSKVPKGGFAIGGFDNEKGTATRDLLTVSDDSIRMYIDNNTKTPKGGFAIGGFDNEKGINKHFLDVSTDATGIVNPSQNRILWYPIKNAFLAGKVLIEKPDSVGINSLAIGYEAKAKGQFSQAMGYKAIARGNFSTAIGKDAIAVKINSFALGENAQAKRDESYAFGRGAIADGFRSFAFGSAGIDSAGQITGVAYARGAYSFALGMGSQALGDGSFAIGIADTALGGNSFSFGLGTCSTGWGAISMGRSTKASGVFSTSMGWFTKATGVFATATGNNTIASGENSFAGGAGSKSQGVFSFAFGQSPVATGSSSIAIGTFTLAQGDHSFSGGQGSKATDFNTFAFGINTLASGVQSVAFGESTVASGGVSTALGCYTKASGLFSTATGNKTLAFGESSFASGSLSKANGWASSAFGFQSHVNGNISAVFGFGTIANSYSSVVLGSFNDTTLMTNKNWFDSGNPVFVIGNGWDEANRKNAFTVLKNSNVGINMVNPQQKLDIAGGNGRVESGYNWLTSSDIRFKKNISTLESSLEKVMSMRGVRFDMIDNEASDDLTGKNLGFIAQELESVIPEVVVTGPDGYKSVAYDKITAVLTEAIKEQQKQIESVRQENKDLKSELEELKTLINNLLAKQNVLSDN